ncbi:MAG TPA: ABC transporter substrate-binding protein, partial [Allosphingosinicella sp.]|nr:ABC transporter substrate-binding protein [Allosphingosinicella sp.]
MKSLTWAAAAAAAAAIAAPAAAQVDNRDPGRFVQSLATTGLAALRGERSAARGKFRALLARHFAVDAIGDGLIRRWRPQISAAQYSAYKAALPGFIVGTYADRLHTYADAGIKVVRVQNQGANAAVLTQIVQPGGRPVSAIWTVAKT